MRLSGLAVVAAAITAGVGETIPMTIPKRYGKQPLENNRKQSREYARSQRSKKEYRLKGVRP